MQDRDVGFHVCFSDCSCASKREVLILRGHPSQKECRLHVGSSNGFSFLTEVHCCPLSVSEARTSSVCAHAEIQPTGQVVLHGLLSLSRCCSLVRGTPGQMPPGCWRTTS